MRIAISLIYCNAKGGDIQHEQGRNTDDGISADRIRRRCLFSFFQAIDAAKKADYEEAERLIQEGKKSMKEAHDAQTDLLSAEADGKDLAYSILMVHAQDHLTMALMYERLASEFISVYKEMNELKGKLINE